MRDALRFQRVRPNDYGEHPTITQLLDPSQRKPHSRSACVGRRNPSRNTRRSKRVGKLEHICKSGKCVRHRATNSQRSGAGALCFRNRSASDRQYNGSKLRFGQRSRTLQHAISANSGGRRRLMNRTTSPQFIIPPATPPATRRRKRKAPTTPRKPTTTKRRKK